MARTIYTYFGNKCLKRFILISSKWHKRSIHAAKLLHQTDKTCHKLKKNDVFLQKISKIIFNDDLRQLRRQLLTIIDVRRSSSFKRMRDKNYDDN